LPKVLADKVCLIVLDDVWNMVDVTPFKNALGSRCRLLVTTRDGGLVTALGAQEHRLDVLTDKAAHRFLANWCDVEVDTLPPEAVSVARECGNLPFALALCGAMAIDGTPWPDMLEVLQEADLTFIEKQFPNYPYPDVLRSLKVSVDLLVSEDSAAAGHYHELAVFPADEAIPEIAVMTLWLHTNGLKERNARKLLTILERKTLLRLEGDAPNRLISLHDLQHDYLRAAMDDLSSLHGLLLEAYHQKCKDGWPYGQNDGYYFEHLAHHLVESGRKDELHELLYNFDWLQAKLDATDVTSLISDYDHMPENPDLHLVQSALRLSAHVLARDNKQLVCQLMGRLQSFQETEIVSMLEQARKNKSGMWLRPLTPSLTPPGGPLIRTLEGHTGVVTTVAVTPDGRRAVSASNDRTLKVWDLETGEQRRTLEGHTDPVNAVAVTPDGRRAVSASSDYTLKVWDMETGEQRRTLEDHTGGVRAVVVTPDGRRAVSASHDRTLKVWDMETGEQRRTLEGHTGRVYAVAVTPDGRRAVSASDDRTLKVWDMETGEQRRTLEGHTDPVNAVAVTPDGRRAVSASDDRRLKVWDMETGEQRRTLEGHTGVVMAVAVTPDGRRAVSASDDSTLKVWDLETGNVIVNFSGDGALVTCAVSPDGQTIVAGEKSGRMHFLRLEGVE
jgi:WD40 repeat protein